MAAINNMTAIQLQISMKIYIAVSYTHLRAHET